MRIRRWSGSRPHAVSAPNRGRSREPYFLRVDPFEAFFEAAFELAAFPVAFFAEALDADCFAAAFEVLFAPALPAFAELFFVGAFASDFFEAFVVLVALPAEAAAPVRPVFAGCCAPV